MLADDLSYVQDLFALESTEEELSEAAEWVATQDASEIFQQMLTEVVEHVRRGGQRG